jgi:hypothetical protein
VKSPLFWNFSLEFQIQAKRDSSPIVGKLVSDPAAYKGSLYSPA